MNPKRPFEVNQRGGQRKEAQTFIERNRVSLLSRLDAVEYGAERQLRPTNKGRAALLRSPILRTKWCAPANGRAQAFGIINPGLSEGSLPRATASFRLASAATSWVLLRPLWCSFWLTRRLPG